MINQTMVQYFEWYIRNDGFHWNRLKKAAPHLARLGVTMVWMPPASKGNAGTMDVGYGVYDLYDLGEFDQKGTIRTHYGTKKQYLEAIHALQKRHILALADIVFNQRMGADEPEKVMARQVDPNDRNKVIVPDHEIEAWTRFTFPGRNGKYSQFVWNASCFTGIDYDSLHQQHGIFQFAGKSWNPNVSKEFGNYDFLMAADVDTSCEWVSRELHDWGKWMKKETGVDGFRLDCLKSIDSHFFESWLNDVERSFAVGEYWSANLTDLQNYLKDCNYSMSLFDVPLHYHLFDCSRSNGSYDVRKLMDNTLCQSDPDHAVAFVDNHDTQLTQALESWIEDWFRTSAYAYILLYRPKVPCVFYGDLYGIRKTKNQPVTCLEEMIYIRSHFMDGVIVDQFDEDPQKACWYVRGKVPIVVLFTIGDWKQKPIEDSSLRDVTWVDVMRPERKVIGDSQGRATFYCDAGCCSVYLPDYAYRKMMRSLHPRRKGASICKKKE